MEIKVCFKCHEEKILDAFYQHRWMADGRLNKCKECTKRDVRENYRGTLEKRRLYEHKRQQTPERRAKQLEYMRTARAKNPARYKANTLVNVAVRDGRLLRQPCSKCGSTDRVQAHHPDYSKPLEVEWLCFPCHRGGAHHALV